MGGDFGPQVTVPASLACLRKNPDLNLIMVGDEAVLGNLLSQALVEFKGRISIQHASQVVEMDEAPQKALKNKKDSSMRVAINLVQEGKADACVSAGNTGALMATARFVLKMIPGIERPAIISTLPSTFGHTHMLDLGANVDSSAEHLYQFAVMGEEVVKAVEKIERPRIGLLNIGEEDMKGNEQVKAAAKLLENSGLNYIGYVEGNSINAGSVKVDLIVADGFVGNVALKSIEGAAKMIGGKLKDSFSQNWLTKLAGLIAYPVLKRFKDSIDPRLYNGASFIGLRGLVIKSHGGADALAFETAIHLAEVEVAQGVIRKISEKLELALTQKVDE
ncbi:phosphate:acyl-[acyl carrier protein] acyltransferase [Methylomonas methanica]|uniref:Phosphate acyltransferase n=3 Tax=Methylococcaceae TaxID=403 RepID=A0A126T7S7_9GAMM|nr:phosphate acyltransferase PlsX [Methylomonas denitrificans]AMK78137.1 phosphate acyltransferase [Methylomonas denitrificans]OAH96468.1 phosphate acyltransferase [Methylomonas methanica]TCV85672.1 phosphate:acyl-[acyl carrier protein] acyltransferase [Methylomonas methanica]